MLRYVETFLKYMGFLLHKEVALY